MTVICCHKIVINDIYFLSWKNLLWQFLKTVMEGLSMTSDTMTVNNCHRFYSWQKVSVVVDHFCCSVYISWLIFTICVLKEEQMLCLGVERLLSLNIRWSSDVYRIKGMLRSLDHLEYEDFLSSLLTQFSSHSIFIPLYRILSVNK